VATAKCRQRAASDSHLLRKDQALPELVENGKDGGAKRNGKLDSP